MATFAVMTNDLVLRDEAWTCYATAKGRLTRCGHWNATGGRFVDGALPHLACVCERCGAPRARSSSHDEQAKRDAAETGLARKGSAREIARAYAALEATVRDAFARVDEAEKALARAIPCTSRVDVGDDWRAVRLRVGGGSYRVHVVGALDEAIVRMRRETWREIVKLLDLERFTSVADRASLEKSIESADPPPITEEAIADVVGRFMRELPSLRERAVLEVFDRYRPHSEGYRSHKSNKVDRIGDKLVITRAVEQAFSRIGGFSLDYHRWVEIASLENVFAMLDGAPKVENELKAAICASPDGAGETRWFRFRCFRNGNLHLTFTRPDLVHEINRIGGASGLRSPDA